MSSSRPYLIRALYQWISDNGLTPHLLVDADAEGLRVPPQSVKDASVVLNVAARAVANLELADDVISFQARFNGVPVLVLVPVDGVRAIYAMENGQGMVLPPEPPMDADDAGSSDASGGSDDADGNEGNEDAGADRQSPADPSKPPARGNHLRLIK
ncbi:MAG: ClpXP protease specificity-enhancing factor [Xanthomonadales bacterium]|nr:ClpXP protease specificity-enhancing factor [Xanthomonadales bacterium]